MIDIQNDSTGTDGSDIIGTDNTWSVSSAGALTVVSIADSATNATLQVDGNGSGGVTICGTSTGAITLTTAVTSTVSETITGSAGTNVFTISAGDAVITDGSLTMTDADDAATLSVTNTATFTQTTSGVVTVIADSTASGNVVDINADGLTTGFILHLDTLAAGLTTGGYIQCYDGTANDFTVLADGATTIAGLAGSNVFTVTAGDLVVSDGSLTITDADQAATVSVTNNTSATASMVAFAGSGTYTGTTTTSFLTLTPSGLTSGTAMYVVGAALDTGRLLHLATDATQTTGTILFVQSTGADSANTSGRGALIDHTATAITSTVNKITDWFAVASTRTTTTGTVADDFDMVSLIKTSVINGAGSMTETGSVLRLENAVTNTVGTVTSTSKGLEVVMDSLGTGDGVEITHAATGGVALDITGAATTVHDVLITTTGVKADNVAALGVTNSGATAAGGSILRVTNTGTPAAATSYLVDFDYTGATMTNNPVGVIIQGGGTTAQALQVTHTGAGANNIGALSVTTSGATAAGGSVLRVTGTGTPAAATSYLVDLDYSGMTSTNNPDCLYVATAGTGRIAHFTSTGLSASASPGVDIESTNAGAVGAVLRLFHQGGSQANADVMGRIIFTGEDDAAADEIYGTIDVVPSDVAAASPDSDMNFSVDVAGTLTQRLQVSGAINGIEVGSGAAAAIVSSNGAFDVTLTTANGAANEPTIVLTDGAAGNVTVTAGGTSGEIDLASPVMESSTQAITGSGAINLTTSITEVNTTGGGAYTLADGVEGQRKFVVHVTDPGTDAVITPTNLAGTATTVTLDAVGDSVQLLFTGATWWVVGGNGHVVA